MAKSATWASYSSVITMIYDDGCFMLILGHSRNNPTDHQSLSYSDRRSRPHDGCTFLYNYYLSGACLRRSSLLLLTGAVLEELAVVASAMVSSSSLD